MSKGALDAYAKPKKKLKPRKANKYASMLMKPPVSK